MILTTITFAIFLTQIRKFTMNITQKSNICRLIFCMDFKADCNQAQNIFIL